ncbi:MAG: tRNA (5-methylaminomethyl-2-thiouridine)(34)-methyltransferase MnmD [Sterolibacterium sp.]
MSNLQPASLAYTTDGTPYSATYDDIYHAAAGGLGQARHVFLGGNGLLGENARWRKRQRFVIVETGFGIGLNFLATWQAWRDDPERCGRLHFVSFEKHPFTATDLAVLHARWPELAECSAALRRQWPSLLSGAQRLYFDDERVILTLFLGAAETLLPRLRARADAFYLDGFAPDKNPELWSPRICSSLARLAVTGSTLATWTVAGAVREALSAAGFAIEKTPGYAGKRQMTRGVFRVRRESPTEVLERSAVVIGAGLAGCSIAERLAARGWQVQLVEAAAAPAQGASGNHAGVLRPQPSLDDNPLARLSRAAFLHARRHLQSLDAAGLPLRWATAACCTWRAIQAMN